MRERPILFSAAMVRAILSGSKTQTRRVVKNSGHWDCVERHGLIPDEWSPWRAGVRLESVLCPYGQAGDRLWGRENFRLPAQFDDNKPTNVKTNVKIHYEADGEPSATGAPFGKLRPCIHLPRDRCRLELDVVGVRVERLHEISEADAIAEGIECVDTIVGANCHGGVHVEETADRFFFDGGEEEGYENGVDAYFALWAKINGKTSLDANPWVWVVEFKRVEA